MSFSVQIAGEVTVLRVIENLTFVNQKEFAAIADRLVADGVTGVVLDLAGITYFGSMAFGLVAKTYNQLKEAGCRLVVVRPEKDEVFQVFKITRLVELIEFFDDEAAALASFGVTSPARETVLEAEDDSVASKIARLADPDSEVRRYSAWSLGLLGDDRAVAPLEACLGDPEPRVRAAAAESLEKLTGSRPAAGT